MDARIILAGQPVDLVGAMRQGNAAAMETNALRQNNQLTDLYRQQGAGLLAGDQGAMNALAGVDPGLAMDLRSGQQTYAQNTRKMEILNANERRAIEDRAASMSAAERAAAAAEIEDAVKMGMGIPDAATWDQMMAQEAPELVGQFGNRQALANRYMEFKDILEFSQAPDPTEGAPSGYMWTDPRNRGAGVTPLPGVESKPADDYGRYVEEETAAGRVPLDRISFTQALKGKGTSFSMDPATGAMTFSQGGAGNPTGEVMMGDVYNPGAVDSAIELIDDIAKNPSLSRVTGPIQGGGGNNIDEFGMARRLAYGDQGLDAVDKIGQLQSKAWLSARAMLKGGGPITDYESKKAEGAVARLSRAKGDAEFRAALQDLRDAITEGRAKLEAARGGAAQPGASATPDPTTAPVGSDEDLMNQLLEGN